VSRSLRRGLPALLLLLFLPVLPVLSQDIYPGKSFTLVPAFSAGYLQPLGDRKRGAGIEMGLTAADVIDRVSFGFSGGYGYVTDGADEPVPFPSLSLKGGYRFPLGTLLSLRPNAAFSLLWPLESGGGPVVPALSAGAALDLHLFRRNYLTLDVSAAFPLRSGIGPYLSFQLGIRHTIPILIDVPPVDLDLKVRPAVFSPDMDGENDLLEIDLDVINSKSVKTWEIRISDERNTMVYAWAGRGRPPVRTAWDGYSFSGELVSSASDYFLSVETVDILGNRTRRNGFFITDVFVYRDGGKLKIRVPGIIFPPGSADFSHLSEEEIVVNRDIIGRIAATLRKFPGYNILIEGHGNLVNWESDELAAAEQSEILVPLSEARARAIRTALIEEGIRAERLDVIGRGGASPIVPFGDEQNRWKNRRVEFILLK